MTDINPKSTVERLLSDLETLADWKEDWEARSRRAHICNMSSVGLSDETREKLLHEGRALLRAVNGVVKRLSDK
jgi:hypothetical protein